MIFQYNLHFFPFLHEPILVLTLFFIAIVLFSKKSPAKTLSWVLVIFFLPQIGIILYLFMGIKWRKRSVIKRLAKAQKKINKLTPANSILSDKESATEIIIAKTIYNIANTTTKLPVFNNNELQIFNDTNEAFESMLAEIKLAKHHVHIEFYTFRADATGERLKNELLKIANKNILVRLVVDAFGSNYNVNKGFFRALKQHPNIKLAVFQPSFFPLLNINSNYRNHRKIIVIDGKTGFLGGMNIGNEYLGLTKRFGYWRDTVIKIKGDSTKNIQSIFFQDWFFATKENISDLKPYFPSTPNSKKNLTIQIVSSSPLANWDTIHQLYFESIASARETLYITTPYFIPDEAILMAMKTAALGGADVKLLIPKKADHLLTYFATHSYLEDILISGVEVYEYNSNKFIHSKIITVDSVFASIGSANLDQRSMNINFEINALIYHKETVKKINADFFNDLHQSRRLYILDIKRKNLFQKGLEAVVRLLSPIL